jgi:hypothetical protein
VQHTLPQQCIADFDYAQCSQAKQIQPGTFTFSARAGSSLDCSATSGTCNTCMPTGEGGCTTLDGLISGEMHNATATVFLDSSYGVFGGPYPAPAPAFPGESGDPPAGPIDQLRIELVFTD